MKILLGAINAKYNHTNLAIRTIEKYVKQHRSQYSDNSITYDEWTINMPVQEILRGIYRHKPGMILLSTYIWNAEITAKIIPEIKKILPEAIIGLGGPEVSYNAVEWMDKFPAVDFIMKGEGEETVSEIAQGKNLKNIAGLYIRHDGEILFTQERNPICNLDDIPFPYDDFSEPEHKIYYYESSRGCPFTCAYCMSSLDKNVRFYSLERVFNDLEKFLSAGVKLVKFVDRTYNLKEERYLSIWQFILEHHNGKTMFHFEIEAEFLSEKALEFISHVPENVMQFEIGVQSCNSKTLEASGRSKETEKLFTNIRRIPKTIHTHLDLIAGLPFEDLNSFGDSFEKTMNLNPDALQLGFLKVLHGTKMEILAKENKCHWMDSPMYEILSTPWLSYDDILFLKDLEILLDAIYNSGLFKTSMNYVSRIFGWKKFFFECTAKARNDGALDSPKKTAFWFDWLASTFAEDSTFMELLKFDFIRQGKTSRFPQWMSHKYSKEGHLDAMCANEEKFPDRIEFAFSEYDEFSINPFAAQPEKTKGTYKVLFVYARHNSTMKNCTILL